MALPVSVVFEEWGEIIKELKGCFVTTGDAGVNRPDMIHLYSCTRFATTIPRSLGGPGSSAPPTARGVLRGLKAAFKFLAEQSCMDAKMGPELPQGDGARAGFAAALLARVSSTTRSITNARVYLGVVKTNVSEMAAAQLRDPKLDVMRTMEGSA
ncbi:hypothetical protein GGF31_001824 [Allomyces arbusculus]|nr:hypothetical protein GGF31_001824 [Allomyces arbusculus]